MGWGIKDINVDLFFSTRLNSEREILLDFQLYVHSTWNKCYGSIHPTLKVSLISIPEGENISAWERRKFHDSYCEPDLLKWRLEF